MRPKVANRSKFDRIAIGSCASDTADANGAVGSRHVFDDDWLAKRCSHPLGHEAPPTSEELPAAIGTIIVIGRVG